MRWMHNETETQPLGTVEDNMIGCTEQQKERAKEARKSCHTMEAPIVRNFKCIIKSDHPLHHQGCKCMENNTKDSFLGALDKSL